MIIHQTFKIAIGKNIYVVEQVAFFPHNSYKGSLALAEQVMSISTKCIIEKCGRVNKWSLDRVLKAVQIQMGMEGEGHDGRGI